MAASSRVAVAEAPEATPEGIVQFRHMEYPNVSVHLRGIKPVQFQSFFYSTEDPAEIAALRAAGGAIMEDDNTPEYRCTAPGCAFVTTKPRVLEAHKRTQHKG